MTTVGAGATESGGSKVSAAEEPEHLRLAEEFPAVTRAAWQKLVADVLRKSGHVSEEVINQAADPESLLASRTYDGFEISPLYSRSEKLPVIGFPGQPPFTRGATAQGSLSAGWEIRGLYEQSDSAALNRAMLADLTGGVNSLWLKIGEGLLPAGSLAEALSGVYLDFAPVFLDAGPEYAAVAAEFLRLTEDRGLANTQVIGNLGADPIGLSASAGQKYELQPAAELAVYTARMFPRLRAVTVNALPFHEAGGSDSQELGMAIASGIAYLRSLTSAGLTVEEAAAQLEFRVAATADQFLTIAKLRAARRIWNRVLEISGAAPQARGMRQHAVTSPAMLSKRDPWVNMLRTTVACFSAGLGGADAITVLPFDSAIGQPDDFSRRMARNTQAILQDEARLVEVLDPAGGSWYVESLTESLAQAAWRNFQEIEHHGGIESALDSGFVKEVLAQTQATRLRRIATREDPLTGVSEFPNLAETSLRNEKKAASSAQYSVNALPRIRYAQRYEALRDRSDAYLKEHRRRPQVFLAALGTPAQHAIRRSFVENLFAAGGIEVIGPAENTTTADVVAACRRSGCAVVCLCGDDVSYKQQGKELGIALLQAGIKSLFVAGHPRADLKEQVTEFLYQGCNVLETLEKVMTSLGVPR